MNKWRIVTQIWNRGTGHEPAGEANLNDLPHLAKAYMENSEAINGKVFY